MPEEERKIEPYYQARAKQLVDTLFDLALLSESLSRDGITVIENLVALYFQQTADSVAKCADITKKYKNVGEGKRHEEEMRWIARAQEAEKEVSNLIRGRQKFKVWVNEVGEFLKKLLEPPYCVDVARASHLFTWAFESQFIPMPDCMPGKIILTKPPKGEMPGGKLCNNIHESGAGATKCSLSQGHSGPHKHGWEEWG